MGPEYARFSDFIYSPATVVDYVKSLFSASPKHYLGHNPAGGWMIVILLVGLVMSSWSGLEAYAVEDYGALASNDIAFISSAYADSDDEDEHDEDEKNPVNTKMNFGKRYTSFL